MNDTKVQEHRSTDSFDADNKWITPCTCGDRFSGPSPSIAFGKWKKHAETLNAKTPTSPSTPPPVRIRVCGCGCGEPLAPRAGGLFRSGHDARFKSVLTAAHQAGEQVRHPQTGELADALGIADWLDERRGAGTFWHDKVTAGHKPIPIRQPRPQVDKTVTPERRAAIRVDALMEGLANRRPAAGDMGVVVLRSGQFGARVIRRNNEDSLVLRLLDGQAAGTEVVAGDHKFTKASK